MKKLSFIIAGLLIGASNVSYADTTFRPYVELKGGISHLTYKEPGLKLSDEVGMFALASGFNVNNGTVGYRGEAEWTMYSKFKDNTTMNSVDAELSFQSYTLMFNNYFDINLGDSVQLYALAGLGAGFIRDGNIKARYRGHTIETNGSDNSFSWQTGVGFKLKPTDNLGIDLAWRYSDLYNNDDVKINANSFILGLSYDF